MRVPYETLWKEFNRVLCSRGFTPEDAAEAATIFAQNSLAGIYSHGLNRFPRVVSYLDRGSIDPQAKAVCTMSFGNMERWDGNRGFGPLNAKKAMDRACQIAKEKGMGMVALGNNNHWMRGGTYGWQAAEQGLIGICWSNTAPNMPAWGGTDSRIGNNPLVMAVPRSNGHHVVVDCALSQFSYGKMEEYRLRGAQLPIPGGYDEAGNLSQDPGQIEKTGRVLPMGYWKGSGLSLLLDLIGTMLSGGHCVAQVGTFGDEIGLTQIMIAIDPAAFSTPEETDAMADRILEDLASSQPVDPDNPIRYPGQREYNNKLQNMELGVPVVEEIWQRICRM